MKKANKKKNSRRSLLARYKALPSDLRSRSVSRRSRAQKLLVLTICIPLMLWAVGYVVSWEMTRREILRDNAAFSELYSPQTQAPASTAPPAQHSAAPEHTAAATPVPASAAPTRTPVPSPSPAEETDRPAAATPGPSASPTAEPTPAPTAEPTVSASPEPTPEAMSAALDATRVPLATPDADTMVFALETPPPSTKAFGDLLALNPETVGFLRVADTISLPVVQRANDNRYYLNHSFDHEESLGGTLFLDGSNLLVPEDTSLIIYGHNMRNGTMFRPLVNFEQLSYLKEHPIVQFNTIYEDRNYVPFAVFTLTADEDSAQYMNIRQFIFDELSWETYITDLRRLSVHDIPIDVLPDDKLLLLVTCEYTHNNGRFVVALRAMRHGETEEGLHQIIQLAE